MKARVEMDEARRVAYVRLMAPKANVLDEAMVTELDKLFIGLECYVSLAEQNELQAIVIEGDGPHFSFGASVEEHLPGQIEVALARLGALLRRVAAAPAPTIAAIRGQCLGGGLELALACDILIAEEKAQLGVPEIKLGVFPPAASVLLPLRIGVAHASAMILTGESWSGSRAAQCGLVARAVPDGSLTESVIAYLDEHFVSRSTNGLRYAARAVRRAIVKALEDDLPQADRIYVDEMMRARDADEGIRAFLERRPPKWERKEARA